MAMEGWISLGGILIQIIVGAYVYGKLTGKVSEHDRRHDAHVAKFLALDDEQGRQWEIIGRHGEKISAIEARVQNVELRGRHT
jgi:hypothetical protein